MKLATKPARWPNRGHRWRPAALEALERTGSYTAVATAIGVSSRSIQRLRDADPAFASRPATATLARRPRVGPFSQPRKRRSRPRAWGPPAFVTLAA